jgi:aquaporin Z
MSTHQPDQALDDPEEQRAAAALERRYLIRFEENLLRSQPLSIRLIVEFVGSFLLVTVVVGAGVINHYAGGQPVTRAAAAIAAGALVMAPSDQRPTA